ncbi:LysR family transcriptional regulator [Roseobacter sp. EG26]|uniref:LysR family transcriptional regulator n=1 Tax=Roseobacter sp. EG26 TaxID=3412477 RepID=UPI003CE54A8A
MSEFALNSVPLEWIRGFEAAGRLGSFTAAASELKVTQAAVSQRITNLEGRIGRPLFLRGARGITLTVDGEAWLPYVSAAMRNLNESFEEIFGSQREKLTISASASVIELWLAPRLRNIPGGDRVQIVFSTRVLQPQPQQLDAMIRVEYGTGDWAAGRKEKLFAEQLSPVAAPKLIAQARDWRSLPRIAVSGPRAGWQEWARFSGDPTTPVPRMRFDSFAAALAAALAGKGVLLASLPLCTGPLGAGELVRLSKAQLETPETYWMIADTDQITPSAWRRMHAQFTGAPPPT